MSQDKSKTGAAPEPKPQDDAFTLKMQEALRDGIAMGIAMANQKQGGSLPNPNKGRTCGKCGQLDMRCLDEHVQMVVLPVNRRHARFFQGVFINGIRYLSNNPSHSIWVPKANDIAHIIQTWEENEDALLHGRVTEHNSGSIGGSSATGFVPADKAWR